MEGDLKEQCGGRLRSCVEGDLGAVWRETYELCGGRLRSCVEGDLGAVWRET